MRHRYAQLISFLVTISIALGASRVSAQIVGVVRGGTSGNPAPIVVANGLIDGAASYVDRAHVYRQVPPQLLDIDLVQVSNTDKNVADYSLEVEVDADGTLYVLIDYRIGDNSNANPPTLSAAMLWVTDLGFIDTGLTVEIDEANDGDIDQHFAVYGLEVEAGTILLGAQNDTTTGGPGGRNMYGVAFATEGVSLACPRGLAATVELQDIRLAWQNGTEAPSSVDILRDGETIADDADVDPPEYLDVAVPPGSHTYELRFTMPTSACDALTVAITTCPLNLLVDLLPQGVVLTWAVVGEPAEVLVLRDDAEIAALQGFITTYTDAEWTEGVRTYTVVPSEGTCPALERTIEIKAPEGIVVVNRGGASANPLPAIAGVGLRDGAVTYVDRAHVYAEVPEELVGAEYVKVSNADKNAADYSLEVELDLPGTLYLLLDWRLGDNVNTTPPNLLATMPWVTDGGFTDTGLVVAVDELNDGSINNRYSVYELEVDAGTVVVGVQNDTTTGGPGDRNMYAVAFRPEGSVPPEACDNGKDDDGDTLSDCDDPDCVGTPSCPVGVRFRRGDADASDGKVNITDAISLLDYLFRGKQEPPCLDAADADDGSGLNLTDGIYILRFLFQGGPEPPAPGPLSCGQDPAEDPPSEPDPPLDCKSYPPGC